MRALLVVFLLLILTITCFAAPETGFLNRTVQVNGTSYKYVVYVPADWTPDKHWPVILFLHGAGERGNDGQLETAVGLPQAIRLHQDWFPFIVVMPQCPDTNWWPEKSQQDQALAAFDAAMKEFNGDPKRAYLTGLSMGGYGLYYIAARFPGRFAALAPVCGGLIIPIHHHEEIGVAFGPDPYADVAQAIGNTPIWIFHGELDDSVPVAESRKMYAALKAAGANVQYSEFMGVKHPSWELAYFSPQFPKWLLSIEKKK